MGRDASFTLPSTLIFKGIFSLPRLEGNATERMTNSWEFEKLFPGSC